MTSDSYTFAKNSMSLYDIINKRRDVRAQFSGESIDTNILKKILQAAHSAPSVGLSQPWDFILIESESIRKQFKEHVEIERESFNNVLDNDRKGIFANIKIEGILESSLGIVVTYDPKRGSPAVLGRNTIDEAGIYSVCLAIENLWLAATAENLGVGWVSFYKEEFLAELINLPNGIKPIAWLCVGPVTHLETVPDLERFKWRKRMSLDDVVHYDSWNNRSLENKISDEKLD